MPQNDNQPEDLRPDPDKDALHRPPNPDRHRDNQAGDEKGLPLIPFNNRRLEDIVDDCLEAIGLANVPPKLFQQGNILKRIRKTYPGVTIEPLTLDSLRGFMERTATFAKVYPPRQGEEVPRVYPGPVPLDFVRDIMALPEWSDKVFPRLKAVFTCPVFSADGRLLDQPGYDAKSQIWYEPDTNITIDPIPKSPSDGDIAAAKGWLLKEYLVDLPFQTPHDRANAVGFLLTPFVREMVTGPTPLGLIQAPVAGTGKGLLAKAIALPSVGQVPEITPQVDNDADWRKVLTSRLVDCPPFVILDNLTGTLKSGALEAALTCEVWADRELGHTRILRLPVNNSWLATGNNVQVSGDLPRRIVDIRLDAKMERPEERDPKSFHHADLLKWGLDNRGKLVWSCLTLIQAWISRGKNPGTETMGSYESWAHTIGGVLRVAGIEGFLVNVTKGRRDSDSDLAQLRAFGLAWLTQFGTDKVGVKDLFTLLEEKEDLLPQVTIAETPIGRKQKLGHFLKKVRDRVLGDYQIVQLDGEDHSGRKQYRLKYLKEEQGAEPAKKVPAADTDDHAALQPSADPDEPSQDGLDGKTATLSAAQDEGDQLSDLDA